MKNNSIKIFVLVLIALFFCLLLSTAVQGAEIQYQLRRGWNMLSFPFGEVTQVQDDGSVYNIFFHHKKWLGFEMIFKNLPAGIKPGDGYWVLSFEDTTMTVTGTPVTAPYVAYEAKWGWNQMGYPYTGEQVWGEVLVSQVPPAPPSSIEDAAVQNVNDAIAAGWLSPVLFVYNENYWGYDFQTSSQILDPKKAFWLFSTIDCYVIYMNPSGTLTGTVTDANTSAPLEGVMIQLINPPPAPPEGDAKEVTPTVYTDAQGNYAFYDITPGNYYISATKSGYAGYAFETTIASGSNERSFAMTPNGSVVNGTVTDNLANPLEGATVSIGAVQATTDAAGQYTLENIPAGEQTVNASKTGFENYQGTVTVTAGQAATHNISMTPVTPPAISEISPTSGGPRTKVIITGTDFGSVAGDVVFNGITTPQVNIVEWTETQVTVIAPDGISTGDLVVSKAGINSNGAAFEVYEQGLEGFVQDAAGNPITDGSVQFTVKNVSTGDVITNSASIADANGSFRIYMPQGQIVELLTTHSNPDIHFVNGVGTIDNAGVWEQPETAGGIIRAYTDVPPFPITF